MHRRPKCSLSSAKYSKAAQGVDVTAGTYVHASPCTVPQLFHDEEEILQIGKDDIFERHRLQCANSGAADQ